jgi:D-alanyl-D-alanine-carboxypeptidase/D-alanyl-D-alanine-endopeptidase
MRGSNLFIALSLVLFGLAGCSDGDDDGAENAPPDDKFAELDQAARDAFESEELDGMGLAIYDRAGVKVFERMYGDFSADRRVAIASASKIVSGTTIFRLIDQGFLSLDSTTADVLGWTDEVGTITLRHLLSFTSGLSPEHLCTYNSNTSIADCVESISELPLSTSPGTRFDYGSTHLHVAARMAEVVTGSTWNELFAQQLRDPLGLPSDILYYTNPKQMLGTSNPLPAGGLRMTMNEYARILRLIFDKGEWQDVALLAPEIFDIQTKLQYPDSTIGSTPAQLDVRYGLTAWLECDTPQDGCATISSPGAFGFTPWLDRETGYYAILGMEIPFEDNRGLAVAIEGQLKPLIEDALSQ